MDPALAETVLSALIAGTVVAGVPLLLAALGEQMSQTAGVLHIGIEGMMLAGAFGGFAAGYYAGSAEVGFAVGGLTGLAVALPMIGLCALHGANQIAVGIALTIGVQGITALMHHVLFARTYPRLPAIDGAAVPLLSDLPVVGAALFDRHPIVYGAIALAAALAWLYRRSHIGLNLRAAGDSPASLDAAGGSVPVTRAWAAAFTGLLAGTGGAYMAIVGAGLFVPFMTGGAGFIAIVLAMLARGRPIWVLVGAAVFGASLSATTALQIVGVTVPTDQIQMLPFVAVLAMLVVLARRTGLPAALGRPYERGSR